MFDITCEPYSKDDTNSNNNAANVHIVCSKVSIPMFRYSSVKYTISDVSDYSNFKPQRRYKIQFLTVSSVDVQTQYPTYGVEFDMADESINTQFDYFNLFIQSYTIGSIGATIGMVVIVVMHLMKMNMIEENNNSNDEANAIEETNNGNEQLNDEVELRNSSSFVALGTGHHDGV